MSFLLTAGGVLLVLSLVSYLRAGRFGLAILALGAGYLLATMWTDTLAAHEQISLPTLSWRDTVYCFLILAPGVLALLFSQEQKSLIPRILQALIIAVFGVALLLPVLGASSGYISEVHTFITRNRDTIITTILLLGIFDMVFSGSHKSLKHKEH